MEHAYLLSPYLLLRTGDEFAAIRSGDRADPAAAAHVVEPQDGFVRDVMRRVVGLPSTPIDVHLPELTLRLWLRAVLDRASDPEAAHHVRSWRGVVSLVPWLGDQLDEGADELLVPDLLAAAIVEATQTTSWERLHLLSSSGGPDSALVRWMDPPFFARWTLAGHRPVTDVLDDLRWFLDGPTLRSLQYTVDAVGWLGFADSAGTPDGTPHRRAGGTLGIAVGE